MVSPSTETARERLLTQAARLFSSQGYASTSVADIQLACGLTAGSGALYKHFASKRALLEEVIGSHIATMRQGSQSFVHALPEELDEALRFLAQAVWAGMQRDRQVLRVMLRDLDQFPDLLDQIWNEVRANVYDEFSRWLRAQNDRGAINVTDPETTATVLLAALTYYPILDALIGHTPGDLDAERFSRAWVQHALATLIRTHG